MRLKILFPSFFHAVTRCYIVQSSFLDASYCLSVCSYFVTEVEQLKFSSWNWELERKSLLRHIDCAHLVGSCLQTLTMGFVVDISATAHITRTNRYSSDKVHISHEQSIWRWRDRNAFIHFVGKWLSGSIFIRLEQDKRDHENAWHKISIKLSSIQIIPTI